MEALHINHVLSTGLLSSTIFEHLIDRVAAVAPGGTRVSRSQRPKRDADVWHYHRPTLEWRLRPRSIVTIHHDLHDDREWLGLDYGLPRYREAAAVHCLNSTQRTILEANRVSTIRVIPHGVDRHVFPCPETAREWNGRRLCLGILSRRYASGIKGEIFFEELLAQLDPDRVSFLLVGAERGHEADAARGRGFAAEHWERLPYRLMRDVYARMDALLILSRFEGGPACLPEALGSGVPVITTSVGMCTDFVSDEVNGIFLTGRPGPDAARIMALLDERGRGLAALNQGAFRTAPTMPSWEEVLAEWHDLYLTVAETAQ
jgi:glycosyltransferase involved in cell wall biosynthesis